MEEKITTSFSGKEVIGYTIESSFDMKNIIPDFPDSAVLIYNGYKDINSSEQMEISKLIVRKGCRYAVCCGYDSSTWDDSIDCAYLEENNYEIREENYIVTTWHNNQKIEDVVFFFLNNAFFDVLGPKKYIVLVIGKDKNQINNIVNIINEENRNTK